MTGREKVLEIGTWREPTLQTYQGANQLLEKNHS